MGRWKEEIEDDDARQLVATSILIDAGVLDRCPIHGVVLQRYGDVQDAYRLGNYLYTEAEKDQGRTEETKRGYEKPFESRREMTDAIKEANDQWYHEDCPMCLKD